MKNTFGRYSMYSLLLGVRGGIDELHVEFPGVFFFFLKKDYMLCDTNLISYVTTILSRSEHLHPLSIGMA